MKPYGIMKVTRPTGDALYEHEETTPSRIIPDHVAAGITDLLQTAVNTGTGRAAQIGRPVAGKTGTTSSNKDGWFIGFSSGITTGVWMGRDDAKPVSGLQGGRAPAQAFAAFMRYAVKDRPIEPFDTDLKLPEWQLEPDDEFYFGDPDDYYYIDEQGNLIEPGVGPGGSGGENGQDNAARDGRGFEPGFRPQSPADGGDPRRRAPRNDVPPAASDDFLDRATGGNDAAPAPARQSQPRQTQPRPTPRPQAGI